MRFNLGFGTRNALLNRYAKDAAFRQTPEEHDAAIHKYEVPGMNPTQLLQAAMKGADEERLLPQYWDDETPRLDLHPSSSWIDGIEYFPDLGIAIMQTNGKEYYYPLTAKEVGDWVTSDSVGSFYNRNIKLK